MDNHEEESQGGENQHVDGIKPRQGDGAQILAAFHDFRQASAKIRNLFHHMGAHGGGPIGFLVPGEKITGKPKTDHKEKEKDSGEPCDFPGILIGPHEKHPKHMQEHRHHHSCGAPFV